MHEAKKNLIVDLKYIVEDIEAYIILTELQDGFMRTIVKLFNDYSKFEVELKTYGAIENKLCDITIRALYKLDVIEIDSVRKILQNALDVVVFIVTGEKPYAILNKTVSFKEFVEIITFLAYNEEEDSIDVLDYHIIKDDNMESEHINNIDVQLKPNYFADNEFSRFLAYIILQIAVIDILNLYFGMHDNSKFIKSDLKDCYNLLMR